MRIYVVKEKAMERGSEFLVRANTKGGALRHVAEKTMSAEVASQDDLVKLIGSGAKVEEAGAEEQTEPAPEPAKEQAREASEAPRKKVWA